MAEKNAATVVVLALRAGRPSSAAVCSWQWVPHRPGRPWRKVLWSPGRRTWRMASHGPKRLGEKIGSKRGGF